RIGATLPLPPRSTPGRPPAETPGAAGVPRGRSGGVGHGPGLEPLGARVGRPCPTTRRPRAGGRRSHVEWRNPMARCRNIPLVLLALALCAPGLSGQEVPTLDPNRIQMSRDELSALLQQYETTGRSEAYSNLVRGEIDAQLQLVRRR